MTLQKAIPNPITASDLLAKGACKSEVDRFGKVFPKGAALSLRSALKAARNDFDIDWFAIHFLSAATWDDYKKARAPAWDAYVKTIAPDWDACEEARATAFDTYKKARAKALWEVIHE